MSSNPSKREWQPIDEPPAQPAMVVLFFPHDDLAPGFDKREPFRDERTELGYWNGTEWCFAGSAHKVFEHSTDREDGPTHFLILPIPPKPIGEQNG